MEDFRPIRQGSHNPSVGAHQGAQRSTTLNRKFVKKPTVVPKIKTRADVEKEALMRKRAMMEQMKREQAVLVKRRQMQRLKDKEAAEKAARQAEKNPLIELAEKKNQARAAAAQKPVMTAQELKEQAIKRAMEQMKRMDPVPGLLVEEEVEEVIDKKRHFWQSKRFVLAISMSTVAVLLLVYFVQLNMPDISVKVAASRAGVDGTYPSYIPRGYSLEGLVSEKNGKIEMSFKSASQKFTIVQEKSVWDSTALYNNFVVKEWGKSAEVLREHGLTIYVNGSDATWVNGGIRYLIDDNAEGLTRQQLRDIAISF